MISVSRLLACFVIYFLVFEGNDNFVVAVCSNADEECCWLKHYEGVEKSINDRPNFQAEITEAFQVGKLFLIMISLIRLCLKSFFLK